MKIIDITGELYTGMWSYEPPFPKLEVKPLPEVPWVKTKVYCEIFEGMSSQSGTYFETPAHLLGDSSYLLNEVPLERLVDMPCAVIKVCDGVPGLGITPEMLTAAEGFSELREGDAVLICTGWGDKWRCERYLADSPWFTYEAMKLLISKKPRLIGSDNPRWENMNEPQGFFPEFYSSDIWMLGCCVNLEAAQGRRGLLTVSPLNVPLTCCAPARAFLRIE